MDEDLIEELIRIKGFNNIKLIEPSKNRYQDTLNFKQKLFHLSQRSLASKGYMEIVTWSFTDSKIDKQFSKGEKEIPIFNPISSDLDVLRRSIFSNLAIYLKKNQDRGYEDLSLFEIGPTFFGKNPGEQQIVVGGLKSGKINRKSWLDKERDVDVFDIKGDTIKTLFELGIEEKNLFVSDNTKHSYHPGRSGSITLKSEKGPHLAYFGENSIVFKIVFSLLKSIDGVVFVPTFKTSLKPKLSISLAMALPMAPVAPTITAKLSLFIKKGHNQYYGLFKINQI